MAKHAILSPSGAHRWLSCPPSARLERQFPDQKSEYAAEGVFAHSLAELKLSYALKHALKPDAFKKELDKFKKNPFYSPGLEEYVDQYVTWIAERFYTEFRNCPNTASLLEQTLDFSDWVPGGFGTGDAVIVSNDLVEVCDLKFGKGVPVSAEGNPQTRLYGLGAVQTYGAIYDFSKVRMTIFQPRLGNISTEELTVDELLTWAEEYVKPRAAQAHTGEGGFYAGEHCQFCRARATCRTRAEKNLELAKLDFQEPYLLSPGEIADILGQIGELVKWAGDVQNYALDRAVNRGIRFPGWKVVEGRSNRKYINENTVAEVLINANYKKNTIYKPRELLGITALEKQIGKGKLNDLIGSLIAKPPGKPTLAPESDKRPEINSTDAAKADFEGENAI